MGLVFGPRVAIILTARFQTGGTISQIYLPNSLVSRNVRVRVFYGVRGP